MWVGFLPLPLSLFPKIITFKVFRAILSRTFVLPFIITDQNRIKPKRHTANQRVCMRNFQSNTIFEPTTIANMLIFYRSMFVATSQHAAAWHFSEFNPSKWQTLTYTHITHCMKTFGDNCNGLTWFRFKIWQQNESDLFASFFCPCVSVCVFVCVTLNHRVLSPDLSEWHSNKNKRTQK